jgi:hypothetical protein
MPPTVLIDLGFETARHARLVAVIGGVADWAGGARSAALTGVRAFPWWRSQTQPQSSQRAHFIGFILDAIKLGFNPDQRS